MLNLRGHFCVADMREDLLSCIVADSQTKPHITWRVRQALITHVHPASTYSVQKNVRNHLAFAIYDSPVQTFIHNKTFSDSNLMKAFFSVARFQKALLQHISIHENGE